MSWTEFISLIVFSVASAWTPGPNNTLLANSGAHFGFKRTIPHVLGVALGFTFMMFVMSLGLGAIFQKSEYVREGIRFIGIAVMLWMAYKTATAGRIKDENSQSRPFTFLGAAAFQWINAKAWVMAMSITAQFVDSDHQLTSTLTLCLVVIMTGLGSASTWAVFGSSIRHILNTQQRAKIFNWTMAALLLFSIYLIANANLAG